MSIFLRFNYTVPQFLNFKSIFKEFLIFFSDFWLKFFFSFGFRYSHFRFAHDYIYMYKRGIEGFIK